MSRYHEADSQSVEVAEKELSFNEWIWRLKIEMKGQNVKVFSMVVNRQIVLCLILIFL